MNLRVPTRLLLPVIAGRLSGAIAGSAIDPMAPLWSLEPFQTHAPPAVSRPDWPLRRVDAFILARLEQRGIAPAPDTDAATLLRRLSFDLVGLPPSPEEIHSFEEAATRDPDSAIAAAAERLLASPEFGARWGRHWLDVARFAESSGNTRNMAYPEAWRYRNYVIRAFNRNLPFDLFVREQIAGDLLPPTDTDRHDERILATGFLGVGLRTLGEQDLAQYELNLADDQIDATCRAFLGLSANCARCHDHKFDPIPARDYYALAGIFRSTRLHSAVETNNRMEEAEGRPLGRDGDARRDASKEHARRLDAMQKEYLDVVKRRNALREDLVRAGIDPARAPGAVDCPPPVAAGKLAQFAALEREIDTWKARLKTHQDHTPRPPPVAMSALDRKPAADSPLYENGEVKRPLAPVPRGVLSRVPLAAEAIGNAESGRRQLANWIASPRNPLTGRVIVNRVWQHLFGRGIVETPDDFGRMGAPPSHPELLDDLAARFVEGGWNVKALIRELVTSRTYRMSSLPAGRGVEIDPSNTLFWRMNRKPLEAEPLRDAMLAVSDGLDRSPVEGSPIADLSRSVKPQGRELGRGGFLDVIPEDTTHRSIFLPVLRGANPAAMQCFDAADPNLVVGARRATVVPAQALYLMNSEFVMDRARALARRVRAGLSGGREAANLDAAVDSLWRIVFARRPNIAEKTALRNAIGRTSGDEDAWTGVCQVLLMTGEFRTVY